MVGCSKGPEALGGLDKCAEMFDFLPVQSVQHGFGDTCISGKSYQLWVV